jgi:hypothetical protein
MTKSDKLIIGVAVIAAGVIIGIAWRFLHSEYQDFKYSVAEEAENLTRKAATEQ